MRGAGRRSDDEASHGETTATRVDQAARLEAEQGLGDGQRVAAQSAGEDVDAGGQIRLREEIELMKDGEGDGLVHESRLPDY